jgi:hypothetical protein
MKTEKQRNNEVNAKQKNTYAERMATLSSTGQENKAMKISIIQRKIGLIKHDMNRLLKGRGGFIGTTEALPEIRQKGDNLEE